MAHLALNGGTAITQEAFPQWPIFGNEEREGLLRVLESGNWGSSKGTEVSRFEKRFADSHGAKHGIAVSSGTTALTVALRAAGINQGDEVIVPSYTFIASATAIIDALAKPVFADIEADTLNLDPQKVKAAITPKTRAIMPVHFAGRPANMDALNSLAEEHQLIVIEDAAQAWGSAYKGRSASTLGHAGCFSFQSSKNINSGEGGIILTNDDDIADMSRSLSNCGRSADGLWYAHYNLGANYRLTEFQGALLQAQLKRYPVLHAQRERAACLLYEGVNKLEGYSNLSPLGENSRSSWHIFAFRLNTAIWGGNSKTNVVEALRAEGIPVSPGYSLPVHKQPVFSEHVHHKGFDVYPEVQNLELAVTEKACSDEILWFTQNMLLANDNLVEKTLNALEKVFKHKDELLLAKA